jgi:hypothetical protein
VFAALRVSTICAAACVFLAGCSPNVKDGIGPRIPIPNISGRAERDGAAAPTLDVSVRNPDDNTVVGSTKTDANGTYDLAAPVGVWEVKIKGKLPGDFDSVTRDLVIAGSGERVVIEPLDVFAYGSALISPSDSETLAFPTHGKPMTFRWRNPARAFSSARAQLFDSAGAAVWYSAKSTDSSATWDGTRNQGSAAGTAVPAGNYMWKVKFDLPDSSVARTATRKAAFQ